MKSWRDTKSTEAKTIFQSTRKVTHFENSKFIIFILIAKCFRENFAFALSESSSCTKGVDICLKAALTERSGFLIKLTNCNYQLMK